MDSHAMTGTPTVRLLEAVRSFTAEGKQYALVTTLVKTTLEVLPARAIESGPQNRARFRHLWPLGRWRGARLPYRVLRTEVCRATCSVWCRS